MFTLDMLFEYLATDYSWGDLIPVNVQPASNPTKLLVITGENATGKSFLRRIISALCQRENTECMAVSPEFRQYGGPMTAFVFGDEGREASGEIATNVCLGSIRTSKGRTGSHVVVLDEPDMGLSDNAAAGVGLEIAEFIQNPPEHLGFFTVISHRRALLERLMFASHIRVGGDTITLEEALHQPIVPIRPDELKEKSIALFRQICPRLDEMARKNREDEEAARKAAGGARNRHRRPAREAEA